METKAICDKTTPGKRIQNILLEKAVQGKFTCTFTSDSPFRLLPHASTPPSRLVKIKNPFESHLTERLHQSVFSPSVFKKMQSCSKTEEKFKWAIEDISSLKPADIDETTVDQFESNPDPDVEQTAQASIEQFFNCKHIVPSPFDVVVKRVPLISESTSPIKSEEFKETTSSMAQTVLTLPPILPKEVEDALKPYFSYTVDQQQDSNRNNNTSLYRRLFEFDDEVEHHSSSSVLTSPAPSCTNLSPIELSPVDEKILESLRNFGSPQDHHHMSECNLSPINTNLAELHAAPSTSGLRMDLSGHMSIDTSLNLVPDVQNQMPSSNYSLAFESIQSPIPEALSNSLVNWDMEYRHISLESPKSQSCMEISNSTTPKSKIFTSQRKKLSDSFLQTEEEMDNNKENIYEVNNLIERKYYKSNLFNRDDTTDGGYHTESGITTIEESWSNSHFYASTPTKSKNC